MHVHLLRHGDIARSEERVLWGQSDVGLSLEGSRQGETLAGWLAHNESAPDWVISSDLTRCRLLGEQVAAGAGLELDLEPRLREQHLGEWQGRTWEEISAEAPELVSAYWRDYVATRPPGGESFGDLAERVSGWWSEFAETRRSGRLVIVTHVGVLRALLASWLGLPLGEALRLAPAMGSHTALTLSQAGCVLEAFGERPWMYGAGGGAGATRGAHP